MLRNLRRRADRARKFPSNTCPASRHVHLMAEALAGGKRYAMLEEEPQHCAESLLVVLEDLWKLRTATGWGKQPPSSRDSQRSPAQSGQVPEAEMVPK